jgi:hypothetical protein
MAGGAEEMITADRKKEIRDRAILHVSKTHYQGNHSCDYHASDCKCPFDVIIELLSVIEGLENLNLKLYDDAIDATKSATESADKAIKAIKENCRLLDIINKPSWIERLYFKLRF